jgi:hypothetical protein
MPVNETAQLEHALATEVDVKVDHIFCNGVYPQRFSDDEIERIEALMSEDVSEAARGACRAALTEAGRAADHREQLARLRETTEAPVTELPFLFEPRIGVEEIAELAPAVVGS